MSAPPVAQLFDQVAAGWQCKACPAICSTKENAARHYRRKHQRRKPRADDGEESIAAQLIRARDARDQGEPYDRHLVDQFKDYE